MSNEIKFFIINGILLSLTIIVNAFSLSFDDYDHHCAFRDSLCNYNLTRSCCDRKDVCKQTQPENVYRCIENEIIMQLGNFCNRDEDCLEIRHSKCSIEKKCICRKNNIEVDKTTCAPILGGFCWKNELCATNNAVCIDNECQCEENYYPRSNNQCIFNTLGSQCETDENCEQVRFARCSEEKICECASNTSAVNLAHCSPLIGGFCWTTDDCLTRHSICVNNKCQCKQLYIRRSDYQCIPVHLNISCTDDKQCSSLFPNSICSETKGCICNKNYFEKSGTECALSTNNSCSSNGSCALENSVCIDNICQCVPLFEFKLFTCVPIYLNKYCNNNSDCHHIQHATCSAKEKCVCDENYIDINGKTCSPVLDGFCSEDTDCAAVNSICIKNACQCKPNYLRHSNKLCHLPQLGMSCKYNNDCKEILYSICSENKKCECISTYVEYNTTACAPLLGRYCSDNQLCAPLNSNCSDNICICDDGYIRNSIDKCIPHHIYMHCENDKDCKKISNTECVKYNCVCKDNYDILNTTTCAPLLGEYCENNQQCASENSICIHNKCQCSDDYKQFNKRCISKTGHFEISCNEDNDCVDIKYAKCSIDKQCVCKPNYVALGGNRCIALVNEYCDSDDECISYNTVCINHKCQCPERFIMRTKYRCDRISLGDICQKDYDCEVAIKKSVCSKDKICVCRQNFLALNEFECAAPLHEHCLNNEECRFNSSICIENKCQCSNHFRSVSSSQCVPYDFLYRCNENSDCGDPWHNRCSGDKKCVCNSNNVSINKSTCMPLLNGYCWIDHQCVVKNSFCDDFQCKCQRNFRPASNNLCIPV